MAISRYFGPKGDFCNSLSNNYFTIWSKNLEKAYAFLHFCASFFGCMFYHFLIVFLK